MNDLIQQNLAELLGILNDLLQSGVELVQSNAPALVWEVLRYGKFVSIFNLSRSGVLLLVMLALVVFLFWLAQEDETAYIGAMFPCLGVFIFGAWFLYSVKVMVMLYKAPTMYIIETLSKFIK